MEIYTTRDDPVKPVIFQITRDSEDADENLMFHI